jgi:hypothetical protein
MESVKRNHATTRKEKKERKKDTLAGCVPALAIAAYPAGICQCVDCPVSKGNKQRNNSDQDTRQGTQ